MAFKYIDIYIKKKILNKKIIIKFTILLNIDLLTQLEVNKDQYKVVILIIKTNKKIYKSQSYKKAIKNPIHSYY